MPNEAMAFSNQVRYTPNFALIKGNDVFSQLSTTGNSDFYYVNKIVISDKDEIIAATRTGLFRSINAGATFSLLLKYFFKHNAII